MTRDERKKIIDDFLKDEKGYVHRPMDWQDKLVLAVCVAATVVLALVVYVGGTP